MNQSEFRGLCRQIADVPWEFGPTVYTGLTIHADAKYANYRIAHRTGGDEQAVDLTDDRRGHLRFMFAERPSPQHRAAARAFFSHLELEYVAREIAPKAPWVFLENHAHTVGILITRRPPQWVVERWGLTLGPQFICAASTAELVAAYREHRAKHEAARGVKTRQRKPQPKPQTGWSPPGLDTMTVEHARNIVACIANPDKYTRIATWASGGPKSLLPIVRRAMEGSLAEPEEQERDRRAQFVPDPNQTARCCLVAILRERMYWRWPNE